MSRKRTRPAPRVGETISYHRKKYLVTAIETHNGDNLEWLQARAKYGMPPPIAGKIFLKDINEGTTIRRFLCEDGYIRDYGHRNRFPVGTQFKMTGFTWRVTAERFGPRGGRHLLIETVPTNYYQQYELKDIAMWVRMSGMKVEVLEMVRGKYR